MLNRTDDLRHDETGIDIEHAVAMLAPVGIRMSRTAHSVEMLPTLGYRTNSAVTVKRPSGYKWNVSWPPSADIGDHDDLPIKSTRWCFSRDRHSSREPLLRKNALSLQAIECGDQRHG
jgi:hypothetical protein